MSVGFARYSPSDLSSGNLVVSYPRLPAARVYHVFETIVPLRGLMPQIKQWREEFLQNNHIVLNSYKSRELDY